MFWHGSKDLIDHKVYVRETGVLYLWNHPLFFLHKTYVSVDKTQKVSFPPWICFFTQPSSSDTHVLCQWVAEVYNWNSPRLLKVKSTFLCQVATRLRTRYCNEQESFPVEFENSCERQAIPESYQLKVSISTWANAFQCLNCYQIYGSSG